MAFCRFAFCAARTRVNEISIRSANTFEAANRAMCELIPGTSRGRIRMAAKMCLLRRSVLCQRSHGEYDRIGAETV